jgi:meiotic recombination protein DMC1
MKLDKKDILSEKPTESKTPQDFADDMKVDTSGNLALQELTSIQGIGPKTAEKLLDLGYDLEAISTGRADEIAAQMKVSFVIAKAWVMAAQEYRLSSMKLMCAKDVDNFKKSRQFFFKTGSSEFNGLLGGGVATMAITGLAGPLATGKTMGGEDVTIDALNEGNYTCPKCYIKLAKDVQCPQCKISSKPIQVVYIETEPDTLHLSRMQEMAMKRNLRCNWDNLFVCPASQIPTMKAQFLQYKLIQKELEKGANIHLIVVDSFNSKLRAGWSRSEMLPIRTRELAEHFSLIEYLANKYNIAWLLSTQVITAPRPEMQHSAEAKFGSKFYPIGGDLLLHSVNQWVSLEQKSGDSYEATLFDSSYLPKKTICFQLTASGFKNGVH